jgi:group II intron reverse transcriptase/maturase
MSLLPQTISTGFGVICGNKPTEKPDHLQLLEQLQLRPNDNMKIEKKLRMLTQKKDLKTQMKEQNIIKLNQILKKVSGKASGDSRLRLSKSMSRLPETILSMVTMRNLIRYAGTSLSYWSTLNNGHVAMWLRSCVQDPSQENTSTALQTEEYITQGPKLNRLKSRKNLRTTGFNLYRGKRSIHSTLRIREGIQANVPFVCFHRSFSQKILSDNLYERVLIMEIKQWIEKCKNKDGRYGNLIRIIGSPSTLKVAYLMIKGNLGISTKGVNNETLYGISQKSLKRMSDDVLSGNFKVKPVRRITIPKPGKKELRPLGVSSPREKIVQKAIEIVLTTIFEEYFLDCSHGFRPGRSCHTALKHLQLKIGNASTYSWVIKGDIEGYFDNIPQHMIIKGISRKVDCPATLNLIKKILNAGYVLDSELKNRKSKAKVFRTDVGTSQGIILSPLFSNIVLHELDRFIEEDLRPEYSTGKQRKANLEYCKLRYQIKNETDRKKKKKLINKCLKIPSKDFNDVDCKRIHYIRYADDWIILLAGAYKDAVSIRNTVSEKLQSLGLNLNFEKTQITSLKNGKCRFLEVDVFIRKNTENHFKPTRLVKKNTMIQQRFASRIILQQAPILELIIKLKDEGFVKRNNKGEFFPIGKSNCIPLTHPQILNYYNSKIRGILNYYSCVHNRNELLSIVRFLRYSCALTLARKFKLKSLKKTFYKFGKDLKFVDEKKRKYTIFRPDNLQILPMNKSSIPR